MKLRILFGLLFVLFACDNSKKSPDSVPSIKPVERGSIDSLPKEVKNNYISEQNEKQILTKKIVSKYGEQFTFCDCIQKGDSLNKALKEPKLTEKQLDILLLRFDEIDLKCQAFRLNDANATPRERIQYKKKVRACLQ